MVKLGIVLQDALFSPRSEKQNAWCAAWVELRFTNVDFVISGWPQGSRHYFSRKGFGKFLWHLDPGFSLH
jgi:hypothetical protein